MTNKDITKIYFRGNEIVALYRGDILIFKKSSVVPPSPTGKYTVRGTLKPDSTVQNIELNVNGVNEQININEDKTFEHTFVNVPVTNMSYFTLPCYDKLKTLDLSSLDTSQVTNMDGMFSSCERLETLDVSNFNTSNVTNMGYMFYDCASLETLDVSNFNTSNVTNMGSMFSICERLETLDVSNFNTSNVTNMGYMFSFCNALASLDVSNFNTSNVTNMGSMFYNCYSLGNVVGKFEGTKVNLYLSDCPLTAASAMVFINGLATVTEKRTLALSATTYDSLTPEQIAIATAKGWTVTRV